MVKMIPKYTDPERRGKDIPIYLLPDYFILPPNLIISLESFGTQYRHWHLLSSEIVSSMDKARKSYINILPEACLYYSIVSLEYALKTKYCLFISQSKNDDEADRILKDKRFSLGSFLNEGDKKLEELGLDKLRKKISNLNEFRNGLIHFNYGKLMKGIKELGYDFTLHEDDGVFVFYTTFIDDGLSLNIYKMVCNLLDEIFMGERKRVF